VRRYLYCQGWRSHWFDPGDLLPPERFEVRMEFSAASLWCVSDQGAKRSAQSTGPFCRRVGDRRALKETHLQSKDV
jgi:hypothetical protein